MTNGLIGRKLGMTRVFADDGSAVPVTVIEAGPCRVLQVKPEAVQLGFGSKRATRTNKAELGHAKKAGLEAAPWIVQEFALARYGFGGGPGSHGNTRHRKPGSIGPGTDPSRVIKGKRMPGHHGAARHTELGLTIVKVDAERNLLFVRGAVPGSKNGIVSVRKQGGKSRHA